MATPRKVKTKKSTGTKKSTSKSSQSRKRKPTASLNPWKLAGIAVGVLSIVGVFFVYGGNLTPFFNFEEPGNPNKITHNNSDEPGRLMNDYLPTQALGDKLLQHDYYATSYATKNKNPEWVAYELTAKHIIQKDARRRDNFMADPGLQEGAKDSDFASSGYDRGHLAPAEDMNFSEKAMTQSFFLSNISPQAPDFNRGIWKKLENHVRTWALDNKNIYVVTGPVLRKRIDTRTPTIGNGVEIPKQFYKVILDYNDPERKGIAFILNNEKSDKPLSSFACSIRKVEEVTGIDFFPKLPKNESDALEAKFDVGQWKME